MSSILRELSKEKLKAYREKATKAAREHDYMSGVMSGSGDTKLAKKFGKKADKRHTGAEVALKKIQYEDTAVPIHKRVEPSFHAPKPKPKAGERIEPHFSSQPKKANNPSGTHRIVRSSKGHSIKAVTGAHNFHIHKDNSVDYTNPEGKVHKFLPSVTHSSTSHQMVYTGISKHLHGDGVDVHVHDKSGQYKNYISKVNKHKLVPHNVVERTDETEESWHVSDDGSVVHHGGGVHSSIDETYWDSEEEMNEAEAKYAPKKLKDIIVKPSRRRSEYEGKTKDERDIIDRIKKDTVLHPDRNGNGDDVFKGSKLKHNGKHVLPGDDEKEYTEWNGDEDETKYIEWNSKKVEESFGGASRAVPVNARHLDLHWATQHVAPVGSHIETHTNKVVLHHPDGTTHHIEGGHQHQSDVKYNTKGKSGKTHAEAGKFNVVLHRTGRGLRMHKFVSQKGNGGMFGYTKTTHDESKAKEFKSFEHAQNHVNHHSQHLNDHSSHFTIHPKRSGAQIKAGKAAQNKALGAARDAFSSAPVGTHPTENPKYRSAIQRLHKATHPGLR